MVKPVKMPYNQDFLNDLAKLSARIDPEVNPADVELVEEVLIEVTANSISLSATEGALHKALNQAVTKIFNDVIDMPPDSTRSQLIKCGHLMDSLAREFEILSKMEETQ